MSNYESLNQKISVLEKVSFDMVWMNYFLNSGATMPLEIDGLAVNENCVHAFETKNRNEINLPTIDEWKIFMNKLELLKQSLPEIKQIFGVFFSANGFSESVEQWLHEKKILTMDWDTWEYNVLNKERSLT